MRRRGVAVRRDERRELARGVVELAAAVARDGVGEVRPVAAAVRAVAVGAAQRGQRVARVRVAGVERERLAIRDRGDARIAGARVVADRRVGRALGHVGLCRRQRRHAQLAEERGDRHDHRSDDSTAAASVACAAWPFAIPASSVRAEARSPVAT